MSDEKEVAESHANEPEHDHEHEPDKQRSGGSGVFLATILAIGALGGSAYLWQQQQALKNDNDALGQSIDKLLGVVEKRHQEQVELAKTVPSHTHAAIEGTAQQNADRLEQLEQQLFQLRNRQGADRGNWVVAETDYLLRIAEHRLNLERDTLTAIAALRTARGRLAQFDKKGFSAVIGQIDNEIDKLGAVQLPDREALAAEVAGLAASVEALPIASTPVSATPASAGTEPQQPANDSGSSIWQKMWRDILGLVTIRRDGEAVQPMMVPEQRYFLKQNLMLKLESARLALLAGNGRAWRASLEESADWLRRYFDINALPVSSAISTVERLAAVELNPSLPKLADTRRLLQQSAMKAAPTAAEANPPKPATAPTPAKEATEATPAPAESKTAPEPAAAGPAAKAAEEQQSPTATEPAGNEPSSDDAAAADGTESPTADTAAPPADAEGAAPAPADVPQQPQGDAS